MSGAGLDARAAVVDLASALADDGGFWASVEVARTLARTFRVRRMRRVTAGWHVHETADEGFLVLSGEMIVDLEDGLRRLGRGQMTIVPAGLRHRARAEGDALVLVFDAI